MCSDVGTKITPVPNAIVAPAPSLFVTSRIRKKSTMLQGPTPPTTQTEHLGRRILVPPDVCDRQAGPTHHVRNVPRLLS
jgi:hypothetical protein